MEKVIHLALSVPGYGDVAAPGGIPTGGIGTGSDIIQVLIALAIVVAIVVALFMIIYSGIQWIVSQGDKQRIETARNRIVFTIIGLIVIFLSFGIINIIGNAFGISLLNIDFSGSNNRREEQPATPSRRDCKRNPNQSGCPR